MKKLNYIVIGIISVAVFIGLGYIYKSFKIDKISFEERTGVEIPNSYKYIDSGLSFLGGGNDYIIFSLDDNDFNNIVNNNPPWGDKWMSGPIPPGPGIWIRFGGGKVGVLGFSDGYEFSGDEKLESLFNSREIFYSINLFSERGQDGEIVILEPITKKVWYSKWSDD